MSLVAQGAITQYVFVKPSAADFGCDECTADTDLAVGVAQDAAVQGDPVSVAFGGVAKVLLGGTVTVGLALTSAADGTATSAVAGDVAHGIALTAGAAGDVISMLVLPSCRLIA